MTEAAKADRAAADGAPKTVGGARPTGPGLEAPATEDGRYRGASRLSDQAQARIGHNLRSLYDSIVQQPVPDRFRELIARLDAQEPKTP